MGTSLVFYTNFKDMSSSGVLFKTHNQMNPLGKSPKHISRLDLLNRNKIQAGK